LIGEKKNEKSQNLSEKAKIKSKNIYQHVSFLAYCLHVRAGCKSLCTAEKAKGNALPAHLAKKPTRRIPPPPSLFSCKKNQLRRQIKEGASSTFNEIILKLLRIFTI